MMKYKPSGDEMRALAVATSAAFDSDPNGLYDRLVEELGQSRADWIWGRACRMYDSMKRAA